MAERDNLIVSVIRRRPRRYIVTRKYELSVFTRDGPSGHIRQGYGTSLSGVLVVRRNLSRAQQLSSLAGALSKASKIERPPCWALMSARMLTPLCVPLTGR